jgi:HAD superfamily 5'-nucleotidase-like hydrolase
MYDEIPRERRIFGNRTLNLRRIRAIGYDMDYTLVHYRVEEWERRAYLHTMRRLAARGWPIEDLSFDPATVIRGLTIDLELGNLVKPTRFGYVIKAAHGTRPLEFDELRNAYAGRFVDLGEERFVFLNTLFSLSEAAIFSQLVDLLDAGALPPGLGYADLYRTVRSTLDEAHLEGTLKGEILEDPDRFVDLDPAVVETLQDQRRAGKRLLLITNSDWPYTRNVMAYAFDRFLPEGTTWRTLFDVVIVSSAKPDFFTGHRPFYRVVDEEAGLLQPHLGTIEAGAVYVGGCAAQVEENLSLAGEEILYVGDHLFSDVHVSKALLRWRTALIIRELEDEVREMAAFAPDEQRLQAMMAEKEALEHRLAGARLARQRARSAGDEAALHGAEGDRLSAELAELDDRIAPLARAAGRLGNSTWGPLMRSGYDKSLFARQVERYADVYTSRVANLLHATPYAFLRAARSTLPHDE